MNLFDLPPPEEKKEVAKPKKPTKQPPIQKQIPATVKKCGDCSHGTFLTYQANNDKDGKPICLKCPFKEFNVGRFELACNEFKKRL